jgi:ubiquinone/menaquinone biosynthesis C-methylase UbiE
MIQDVDFGSVIDLAAGHGRNSRKLLEHTNSLTIVDINQECIDYCKKPFQADGRIRYIKTNGVSLSGIDDNSTSLIYSFDSMVHFDSDVIKEYMYEFYRVLKPGGSCFCHHSNYTGNPTGHLTQSPHVRNFMSKELFAHYAAKGGLRIVRQQVIDWADIAALDCLSLLSKD